MPLEELLIWLRRRPFRPFRVFVSDGAAYDARHPELVMPGKRSVLIGFPANGETEPVYERFVDIDLVHITRFEPLPSTTAQGQAG